jgi:hypothetical protein
MAIPKAKSGPGGGLSQITIKTVVNKGIRIVLGWNEKTFT